MTSVLKVTEIQDPTNSNSALTIDSSGNVEIVKSSASASFSSGSTLIQPTTNGIPSWANEIKISFFDVSQASSANVMFRAYVGGSVVTTNYQYTSTYFTNGTPTMSNRSGGSDGGFSFYGWTDPANTFSGTVTFTKVTDDYKYVAFGQYYNHAYGGYFMALNGRVDLAGSISGVDLYTSTNFDSGSARVIWR